MQQRQFRVSDHIIKARVESGFVLLNLQTGEFYGLEETSVRFWEFLSTTGSIEETVRQITEEYDVDATEVEADLEVFIVQLKDAGLLTS